MSSTAAANATCRRMKPKHDASTMLEEESRRMEERLHMLRKMMSAEKAAREAPDGHFWKSSQPSFSPQPKPPPPQEKQGEGPNRKPLRVKVLRKDEGKKAKKQQCGQCSKTVASLACVECVENYCLSCFAKFHQKGALSKHHVKPLTHKAKPSKAPAAPPKHTASCGTSTSSDCGSNERRPSPTHTPVTASFSREERKSPSSIIATTEEKRRCGSDEGTTNGRGGGGRLLEGEYDEEEAARSFQEALREWRGCKEQEHHTTSTAGTSTSDSIPQVCSTQTPSYTSPPSYTTREDSVRFSKHLGGVSYLERLMVRRHRIDPHFLTASHKSKQSLRAEKPGQDEWRMDGLEEEEDTKGVPSQYNLFYASSGNKESETLCDEQSSSSACLEVDDFPQARAASSVKIEEVIFGGSQESESMNAKTGDTALLRSRFTSTSPQQKASHDRGTDRKHAVKRSKQKTRRDKGTTRGKEKVVPAEKNAPLAPPQKESCSSTRVEETVTAQPQPSLADSIRQTWAANPRITSTSRSSGHLSEFFLAGVETTAHDQNLIGEEGEGTEVREKSTVGYSSRSVLPISATIWLPENSSLTDQPLSQPREERLNPHSYPSAASASSPHSHSRPNPLLSQIHPPTHSSLQSTSSLPPSTNPLRTSIYHMETDLPPPSRGSCTIDLPSTSCSLPQPVHSPGEEYCSDSSSVNMDDCNSGSESEADGDGEPEKEVEREEMEKEEDSEALEDLAWELQSMTGGRLTRCEGEVEEGEEEEEEEEEEEGGEEDGGFEELEAGMERVMSSFEMYQQQLMQQDSD